MDTSEHERMPHIAFPLLNDDVNDLGSKSSEGRCTDASHFENALIVDNRALHFEFYLFDLLVGAKTPSGFTQL